MEGTPNLATQVKRKALTQDSEVMELNGATSGQPVVLSIMVRRYMKPWLERTRAQEIQVNVRGEPSRRNRYRGNRSMNMGFYLALLATETRTSPETHVSGRSRPNKPG